MAKSWTIGCDSGCDLVVDRPVVSGTHCRLTQLDDGFLLEDLGSTNGTYVNGRRVTAPLRVSRSDTITLGQVEPMPWPAEATAEPTRVVRIGREPDNDVVVDLPTVSGHHARLVWEGAAGEAVLEDLGSSNGTSLGAPGQRITRTVVTATDTVYLGTHALALAPILARFGAAPAPSNVVPDAALEHATEPVTAAVVAEPAGAAAPSPEGSHPRTFGSDVRDELVRAWGPAWRPVVLLVQAVVVAVVIVGVLRPDPHALATREGWVEATRALAALLFWLGLAAVWFGMTTAVVSRFCPASTRARSVTSPAAPLMAEMIVLAVLCGVQCLVAWMVVAGGASLRGAGPETLALLLLAAAVGLALGLTVVVLLPRAPIVWLGLLLLLPLLFWLIGGEWKPLPAMAGWARTAASAAPSRWVFEGLLLVESASRPAPTDARPVDLAEPYFPAATLRMGLAADATALAATLLGLGMVATFIATDPKAEKPASTPTRPASSDAPRGPEAPGSGSLPD
jgi:FHA domain